jgi:predicted short-subunit dehydrogenase-like oxidoreductase (DUF2520 family)
LIGTEASGVSEVSGEIQRGDAVAVENDQGEMSVVVALDVVTNRLSHLNRSVADVSHGELRRADFDLRQSVDDPVELGSLRG